VSCSSELSSCSSSDEDEEDSGHSCHAGKFYCRVPRGGLQHLRIPGEMVDLLMQHQVTPPADGGAAGAAPLAEEQGVYLVDARGRNWRVQLRQGYGFWRLARGWEEFAHTNEVVVGECQ
jgi:hypothetical protein